MHLCMKKSSAKKLNIQKFIDKAKMLFKFSPRKLFQFLFSNDP